MKGELSKAEIKELVEKWNESDIRGKIWRIDRILLKWKNTIFHSHLLETNFFDEARFCWISGNYVATIVMSQLTFEESLRAYFRIANGDGKLNNHVRVEDAGFYDLITESRRRGLISNSEARDLHRIRRHRNYYIHTKQEDGIGKKHHIEIADNHSKFPDEQSQLIKMNHPSLTSGSVIAEAQDCLDILLMRFPDLSDRLAFGYGPIGYDSYNALLGIPGAGFSYDFF